MVYNYRDGKKRICDILNTHVDVQDVKYIPNEQEFTFDNSYYGWVTAVFVDIRESTKLFANNDKVTISKIIRSFTSEIIEILRDCSNMREVGIRGDCVYAIYSTPYQYDIDDVVNTAVMVNTAMEMLNTLLSNKDYPNIEVGIGIASAQELVVKAGREHVGINSRVWIGEAVSKAAHLSALGNKNYIEPIVISSVTYDNIIEIWEKRHSEARSWFSAGYSNDCGSYYHGYIINTDFRKWINEGMPL